jgi:hypothetical protein
MMLHDVFVRSWVPGVLLWVAVDSTRHYLTVVNDRLYRAGARERFEWQGSALPVRTDRSAVERLRWYRVFSAIALVGIAALLVVVRVYSREFIFGSVLYLAVLGSCALPRCTTNLRLLNNYYIFRGVIDGSITGKVLFPEAFVRRASAAGFAAFAAFYLLLGLIIGDWFCLGGALGSLVAAYRERERMQQPAAVGARCDVARR